MYGSFSEGRSETGDDREKFQQSGYKSESKESFDS